MNMLPSQNILQLEKDRVSPLSSCEYTDIPGRIGDAILKLIAPDTQPEHTTNPFITRILLRVSDKVALQNEVLKPVPDLNVLKETLVKRTDKSLRPLTDCLLGLLDNGHSDLADNLLPYAASASVASTPEMLIDHLVALLRLGRLSAGFSIFRQWEESLASIPGRLPVKASFQLGLWHLREAKQTFSDPQFPEDCLPGLKITRQLLRCISGHKILHSDLEALRNQEGLREHDWLNLGVLCREAGDFSQALELLPYDSSHLFARLNRAVTLAKLGNDSDARQALEPCNIQPGILNGRLPSTLQMQDIGNRLTSSYGKASTTPYFHFLTQLTVARLSFPHLSLRELLIQWHTEYSALWRHHPEGSLIPEQLVLPEKTS